MCSRPPSYGSYGAAPGNTRPAAGYMETMTRVMVEGLKTMVTSMVETVMESSSMRLAMIVSGIVFAQTSILNFTYFLNTVNSLLSAG